LKKILKKNSDINHQNDKDTSALILAARLDKLEMAELILAAKPKHISKTNI